MCNSGILFILSVLISSTSARQFLFKLEGEANDQEFIYYKIMHPGNLLLVLDSVEGDADIYISEKTPAPTYHPDSYDFHSATCGIDSVVIPKNLKRPMAVGIYGYGNFNQFNLAVYQLPDSEEVNYFEEEDDYRESMDTVENVVPDKKETRKSSLKAKRKLKNISNGLWPFLELFEILFM